MNNAFVRFFVLLNLLCCSSAQAQDFGAPRLSVRGLAGGEVELTWPGGAVGFVLEQTDQLTDTTRWEKLAVSPSDRDSEFAVLLPATGVARFVRLRQDITRIAATSPVDGETGVAVMRETILHFNAPLSTNTVLTTENFHATFGGRRILSRVELSSDRLKASLFYQEPLPGSARIVVVFDANGVTDSAGRELDGDDDGIPGGVGFFTFDTLSLSELAGTAVIGMVFAAEADGTAGAPTNRPLEGVTITVDGREQELRATTDAQGKFTLSPVPPGRFFVKIDGRTASGSSYPSGAYYPYVGKAWEAVAGKTNNLAGGTGEIFLPLISSGSLQAVSQVTDTTVSLPASVLQTNSALAGLSITVPANALFDDSGNRGGRVGVAPVPPDRLPGPLPVGLNLPLVVTVQTDGPLNFDRPAPICFPNTENLPAGEKRALISFNHKKGEWEVAGSMTVSGDRKLICTDPGVGVTQPGWHGTAEGAGVTGAEPLDSRCDPNEFVYDRDEDRCEIVSATKVGRTGYCEVIYLSCKVNCSECLDDIAAFQSCIAYCGLVLARCIQRDDICPWPPQEDDEEEEESEEQAFALPPSAGGLRALSARALSAPPRTAGSSSSSGLHYFAIENLSRNVIEQRGTSIGAGPVLPRDAILAPRSNYRLWVMSAKSKRIGTVEFTTPASGQRLSLPAVYLWPTHADDTDVDGLNDVAEMILGSNPANRDSDGDGVADGPEVTQGLNPLDGFEVRTGLIATTKTPGPSRDVWTGNQLVATALGNAGIALFSLYDGVAPTMFAHLPLGANITRVSGSGDFVVAVGGNRAFIINAENPARPQVAQAMQIAGAKAVTAGGGMAYVGSSSGQIVALHLESASVHGSLTLPGTVDLQDLALEGGYLYAVSRDRLFSISLENDTLALAGSAASPIVAAPHSRLFVGGQMAYAVHSKGFNTLSVTNPPAPALLAGANTAQFGWKQIVLNGSGLGLAAVGQNLSDDGAHNLSLYDVSDPRSNNVFVATFPTPGIARAVSIHHGLAYVADDTAGVQIVNFLAYDANGIPPNISLRPGFAGPGVQEGSLATVSAAVTDDVQVRNVELYLDGVRAFSDGAYPFEFRFVAPALSASKTSFRVRARAVDTGGNSSWSDDLTINLSPDTTAPNITRATPVGGGRGLRTVTAFFTEPIDPATLNASTFRLSTPGPDGQFGTADDVPFAGGSASFADEARAGSLSFPSALPSGRYRATISSAVADLAGNTLTNDVSWQFRIADAVFWSKTTSGAWGDPLNWSTGSIPGTNDNVIIDIDGADITVTQAGGTNLVRTLAAEEQVVINGAIFQATEGVQFARNMTIDRGTIRSTTLNAVGAAKLVCVNNIPSTLQNVTLNGDLDVTAQLARVNIRGVKVNGTIFVDRAGNLTFEGNQTIESGTLVFGGREGGVFYNSVTVGRDSTVTFGPAVTVRGQVANFSGPGTLINEGRIIADVAQGTINLGTARYTNVGTNECRNGGRLVINAPASENKGDLIATGAGALTLQNSWTNSGTIHVHESTVNLDGTFTLAQLGTLLRTGGTVNITGILNLTGDTLRLNAQTGSWLLDTGTINGGIVELAGGAKLSVVNNAASTLDGVTINGGLDVTSILARVIVRNGLNISGPVLLDRGGSIAFSGNQTFAGIVAFGRLMGGFGVNTVSIENNTTLTLAPSATVRGNNGNFSGNGTLLNRGVISADAAGGTINIANRAYTNHGTNECRAGGAMVVTATTWSNAGEMSVADGSTLTFRNSWTNNGAIDVNAGTLALAGTFTEDQIGTIRRTGGTIKINGILDLTGDTLTLNAATGPWQLESGTIRGGTIALADGIRLMIVGNNASTLDAVTINGDLDLTSSLARAIVRNGLTISGTAFIDRAGNLTFSGTQSFPTGSIVFGSLGANFFANGITLERNTTLTVGAAAQIRGHTANITGPGTIVNEGTILADVNRGTVRIDIGQFINNGVAEGRNGGTLVIVP